MKHLFILALVSVALMSRSWAQQGFKCVVKDAANHENLRGVTAEIDVPKTILLSDENGIIYAKTMPAGTYSIRLSHVGYAEKIIRVEIPQKDPLLTVFMDLATDKLSEVIISSSRTNSRIEDLPTKVEVIGSEEMDEESATIPGNIARLLGDVAGIQNQQTSSISGNTDMRVQGLPGRYTQILRDGLPLFGGYSGSFSILQIPPLDLKQAEIIKGSSSTLYGGGAIAGIINLVSKQPQLNKPEHSILVNHSTLNETNVNAFFSSRGKKAGYTFFTGTTFQKAKDVNADGFSDVPNLQSVFFHPRLFLYAGSRNVITLGYNATFEDRKGGDMQVVLHQKTDSQHRFFTSNRSFRNTFDAGWENRINTLDRLNVRATISLFNRDISTNVFGMKGMQNSFFTEISYLKKTRTHDLVAGFNFSGERFTRKQPDSSAIADYNDMIAGAFIQDDWRISHSMTAQGGIRLDYMNNYGARLLPRISLLYKINRLFTTRLGGGLGYKVPSVFSDEPDERELRNIALSPGVRPEQSQGINWDINYKHHLGEYTLNVNQMFFVTRVNHPLIIDSAAAIRYYINAGRPVQTAGIETYMQVKYDELEIYVGYAYTVAKQLYNAAQPFLPLAAKSKFATVISNEFSSRFRGCIEASYTGKQYLDNGTQAPGYFISNAMIRYDFKNISFTLNCENLFDYRQTKKESIVLPPYSNPSFRPIWGPTDGRVLNLSARISW